jgi:hypothetical protein
LVSEPEAPLGADMNFDPQNVWHQPVIPKDADRVVVSFRPFQPRS